MRTTVKMMMTATAVAVLALAAGACSSDEEASGPPDEYAAFCEAKLAADSVPQMSPTYADDVCRSSRTQRPPPPTTSATP
jgi:predicted outer membrane protein